LYLSTGYSDCENKNKKLISRTKFESAQKDAPEFIPGCGVVGASRWDFKKEKSFQ